MKRLRTLRFRFALGTAGLLLIVLSAFAIYVYESMARRLLASVDQSLELVAAQVVSGLELKDNRPAFAEPFSQEPENVDLRQRGFTVGVHAPGGDLLAGFGSYQGLTPPPPDPAPAPTFATRIAAESNDAVRLHVVPITDSSGLVAIVQVAKSLEEAANTLDDLRTTLMVAIPVLVAMAGLGGYLLAARALAPIDRITRTAHRISAEDLSQRIGLPTTNDEVGRLAGTFDAMLSRIEESFRRERRFSADASHELRTPLSAIQAILSTIREKRRSVGEYEQALADVGEEADRLQSVAADLLQLARLDSSASSSHERVDLTTLLNDLADSFRPQAEAKGLSLTGDVPGDMTVSGSSDDLIRLFANLIDNAVKFTEAGRIRVSAVWRLPDEIAVAIADTGIGIPEDHLPRIFDRFYRGDLSRASPGTGLGLAIAMEIARAHGGSLRASSEIGRGSTFEVVLPRAGQLPPQPDSPAGGVSLQSNSGSATGRGFAPPIRPAKFAFRPRKA
jgi:heavy metal sensor kinase